MNEIEFDSSWRATVFGEASCAGNPAVVRVGIFPLTLAVEAASVRDDVASCFTWPDAEGGFGVSCWSRNNVIRCCGHGMLATAAVLHTLGRSVSRLLPAKSSEPVPVWHEGEHFWLALSRLPCSTVRTPAWAELAFSRPPVAAATAGGEEGYLVLEFGPDTALAELRVDHNRIGASTRRAVIVTQRMQTKRFAFCQRYFAPQYGVPEDAVTGSAGRVLADFWNQRIGGSAYSAWQCSAEGGVIHLRIAPETVEVGGTVEVTREG